MLHSEATAPNHAESRTANSTPQEQPRCVDLPSWIALGWMFLVGVLYALEMLRARAPWVLELTRTWLAGGTEPGPAL